MGWVPRKRGLFGSHPKFVKPKLDLSWDINGTSFSFLPSEKDTNPLPGNLTNAGARRVFLYSRSLLKCYIGVI